MAAYRIDGGRLFYVEHECASAKGKNPGSRHVINKKVHNSKYVVRMFYVGDIGTETMVNANDFAYMTDGVNGGGPDAYVNCPLCGSEGHITLDKDDMIELNQSFNPAAVTESPFE